MMKSLKDRLEQGIALAGKHASDDNLCREISVGEARKVLALYRACRRGEDALACAVRVGGGDPATHECCREMRAAIAAVGAAP